MVIWTKVLWPFWLIQLRVFVYLWIIQNHIYIYNIYIYNKYDLYNIHWGPPNIAGQRRSGIGVPWEPWGAAVVSLLGSVGVPTQGEGCLLRFVQCVGAIQVPLRSLSFGEFWCLPKAVHPPKASSHMTRKIIKKCHPTTTITQCQRSPLRHFDHHDHQTLFAQCSLPCEVHLWWGWFWALWLLGLKE